MKTYKIWARVEVYDSETDEYEEIDPNLCEYKMAEFESLEDVAAYLGASESAEDQEYILEELQHAVEHQGLL